MCLPQSFLQDPDASNEETDELLSKQFAQLGDAFGDSVPAVRQAAVSGVCKLLNTFWELIPGAVTAGFLKRVAGASQMPSLPRVSFTGSFQGTTCLLMYLYFPMILSDLS